MHTILVVDDEHKLLEVLSVALESMGYETLTADSAEQALDVLLRHEVHLVLSDLRLPGLTGRELLGKIRAINPALPVIIMTAYASVRDAVDLIKDGAFDYIAKPFDLQALEATVAGAVRFFELGNDNRKLRQALGREFSTRQLIGKSRAMEAVRQSIAEVSASDSNVLIMGESGTGKELIAKSIHYTGTRAAAPFVIVNCAAIPEALLESELFGHVKGAFTGAVANRPGRFVQASGGSLFLDEIGDMPLALQAKMLRAIQEKTIDPIGGTTTKKVDVRIIAATNMSLADAVKKGSFRQDLYYRLNVYPIFTPPLRERLEDIPLLVEHFALSISEKMGKQVLRFSPGAMQLLRRYLWPGNIRELENCIERLSITNTGSQVEESALFAFAPADSLAGAVARSISDVPFAGMEFAAAGEGDFAASPPAPVQSFAGLQQRVEQFEREMIMDALEQSGGVQIKAAKLLGISERSMWHKIKKFKIQIRKEAVQGQ